MAHTPAKILVIAFTLMINTLVVKGALQIVSPFPNNMYPIEHEDVHVTCIGYDAANVSVIPSSFSFANVDQFNNRINIPDEGPEGHTYYSNRTEENGRKLFASLHLNNVTGRDGQAVVGSYECTVRADAQIIRHGFSIVVIPRSEIPALKVHFDPKSRDNMTLICNITDVGTNPFNTRVARQTWAKNNKTVRTTYLNDQAISTVALQPLAIGVVGPTEAGLYTCELGMKLRNMRNYTIAASTDVRDGFTQAPKTTSNPGPTRATTGPVLTGTQWDPRSGSTRYTASRIAIVLPGLLWMSRTAL
ncbi:uncharacterized protein LOC116613479 isoform X5 [Nematostella vectensis]|uniref:uncharacterized protein LOC116613479 isoform X5 n=1 Tax=Nematostella vectensis TaxID=45351 RepID=UPI00138FFD5C|nr:uncharacterized protein LOC116613479 isoform X5 [Nematostella vectensis]